jgi:tetratricopeptide (TPR) repeat protein
VLQDSALDWRSYVDHLTRAHGSLARLALRVERARPEADAATIERGLRRLRQTPSGEGGKYGRWLLAIFGLPTEVEATIRWMGMYHTRFSDLPVPLCLDLIRAWDRPPVSESKGRAWLELGRASCALRLREFETAVAHARQAVLGSARPDVLAEASLVRAFAAQHRRRYEEVTEALDAAERATRRLPAGSDEAVFRARHLDQSGYNVTHPKSGPPDLSRAAELYEAMPTDPPFSACKRAAGLAYVAWRRGSPAKAARLAGEAAQIAGDAGYVRLRVGALGLLAHITGDAAVARRVEAIAKSLGDAELAARAERVTRTTSR